MIFMPELWGSRGIYSSPFSGPFSGFRLFFPDSAGISTSTAVFSA